MLIIVVSIYCLLVYIQLVPLYQQKKWGELWLNTALTLLSFTVAALLSLGVQLPTPAVPLQALIFSVVGR